MTTRCAVVGIGQTKHTAKRDDVSIVGLVREAALRALADANLEFKDIDAVVIGKAPDFFEGVVMPELWLADALGAAGKPMLRVHTAGSVGGSTAVVGTHLITGGVHKRVLVVAFEKQSESDAMWALSPKYPFQPPLMAGAGGYFAPLIRAYMKRSGAPVDCGIRVAVKDRQNALKNPYAHLHLPDISEASVKASPLLWDPIRYLETCPSSDGACAMVLAAEDVATGVERPAWVHATELRTEPTMFAGRDQVNPHAGRECAASLFKKGKVTNPREQIDVAELYVPFSWFEPMWLENLGFCAENEGHRLTMEGVTAMTGDLPINPSGGVLSTNPIGASGMIRFAEAALQVRGRAGDHQIDGAKLAVGHAYGGASQFFAMWLVGSERPLPGRDRSQCKPTSPICSRASPTPSPIASRWSPVISATRSPSSTRGPIGWRTRSRAAAWARARTSVSISTTARNSSSRCSRASSCAP
jgi:acetyl-CoA C-acetyltransferase